MIRNLKWSVEGNYAKLGDVELQAELTRVLEKFAVPGATVFSRMLCELHAHQIELEIQQRELLKVQQQLEASRHMAVLADTSRDEAMSRDETMYRRLHTLAYYDELTGLANRNLLYDRLTLELVHARRSPSLMAILFIDLDGFKEINDLHGHLAGDQLLREVAKRLLACVREGDTVSRLGGDEFVALLRAITDEQGAAEIAGRMLQACAEPFYLAGLELIVTASVGISFHPRDGDNVSNLLRSADIAMYRAKTNGKNNYQFFSQPAAIDPL